MQRTNALPRAKSPSRLGRKYVTKISAVGLVAGGGK